MKKQQLIRAMTMPLVAAVLIVAGCGKQETAPAVAQPQATGSAATATAMPAATARTHVIVGVEPNSVPLTFWDNRVGAKPGDVAGYDADLAKEAFKRAGLQYEFKAIKWNAKEDELLKKNIDVVWSGLTITDERAKTYAFTTPYYKNRQAILVRADSSVQSKTDLKGKKVGEQKGSPSGPFIQSLEPAQHEEFLELSDLFHAVLNGTIDAAVTDGVFIDYYAVNTPGKFRVLADNLPEKGFAVGLRPADRGLLEKLNKALAEMEADGTTQAIYNRWFGASK